MISELMSIREAAEYAELSESEIYELVQSGNIPFRRIHREIMIDRVELLLLYTNNIFRSIWDELDLDLDG